MSSPFNTPISVAGSDFRVDPTLISGRSETPGIYGKFGVLDGPQKSSPVQPGAEPQGGWGDQLSKFLTSVGRLGAGLGAGIAAARGNMPMAGQLLSSYFQDKTNDTEGDSLAKALKTLQDAGLISKFTLDVGSDTTKIM